MATNSSFTSILGALQQPTKEIVKDSLFAREFLQSSQAEYITYICCFIYYDLAYEFFDEFQLKLFANIPSIYDGRNNKFFIKVLVNDLTHSLGSISINTLSSRFEVPIWENEVGMRSTTGEFVNIANRMGRFTRQEHHDFFLQHEIGLSEKILMRENETINHQSISSKLIYCMSFIMQRNIGINLQRLFYNLGAIIIAEDQDDAHNLSISKMKNLFASCSTTTQPKWYVIESIGVGKVLEFLDANSIKYHLLARPESGIDYIGFVLSDLGCVATEQLVQE
jgi:hypothetical protein